MGQGAQRAGSPSGPPLPSAVWRGRPPRRPVPLPSGGAGLQVGPPPRTLGEAAPRVPFAPAPPRCHIPTPRVTQSWPAGSSPPPIYGPRLPDIRSYRVTVVTAAQRAPGPADVPPGRAS